MYLLDLVEGLHCLAARSDKEGVGVRADEHLWPSQSQISPFLLLCLSSAEAFSATARIALG